MEYEKHLWLIVPVFMTMVWQLCNLRLCANELGERKSLLCDSKMLKYEWRNSCVLDVDPLLGLHMIIVALQSGVAIPRALASVGSVLPGGHGLWMCNVAKALLKGDTWHEAWSPIYVNFSSVDKKPVNTSFIGCGTINSSSILSSWLRSGLRESWLSGSSPVPVLVALANHYEKTMANVARQETSKLSVRLLLPVGLCFLPAFICIGILPTVVSLMH